MNSVRILTFQIRSPHALINFLFKTHIICMKFINASLLISHQNAILRYYEVARILLQTKHFQFHLSNEFFKRIANMVSIYNHAVVFAIQIYNDIYKFALKIASFF